MEKRSLNRTGLAGEWHLKQSKGEPDPFSRGPEGTEYGARPVNPDEVRRLVAETSAPRRRSTELFSTTENLKGRLDARSEIGSELDRGYDSDGMRDTLLIKNSSEIDVQIAKLDYGVARFRLLILRRG